jgi:phage tail sheath protein FI
MPGLGLEPVCLVGVAVVRPVEFIIFRIEVQVAV